MHIYIAYIYIYLWEFPKTGHPNVIPYKNLKIRYPHFRKLPYLSLSIYIYIETTIGNPKKVGLCDEARSRSALGALVLEPLALGLAWGFRESGL